MNPASSSSKGRMLHNSWLSGDVINPRLIVATMFCGLLLGLAAPAEEDSADSKAAAALRLMHDEMAKLKVTVKPGSKSVAAEFKTGPILRYTDPQRAFPDATLWAWTVDGVPVVFSKLERIEGPKTRWQYCIASVCEDRVAVRWADGSVWGSTRAGIEFKKLDQKDPPQKTAALRLIQMRTIVRNFRAVTTDREEQSEEMRVLTQPLLRYSNPGQTLIDGAVFGLSSNGTNPDSLLLVQVHQSENQPPIWEYGCLAMTGDAVSIELDGKNVFRHPAATGPGDFGHWAWIVRTAQ